MAVPTPSETLLEAHRSLGRHGRVALCQIVATQGSTPGKAGWKLVVRRDGSFFGNLGGGAFEALVQADARQRLEMERPATEVKRYFFTEDAVRGESTGMVCGGLADVLLEVLIADPVLLIFGGGPVGQALAAQAALGDFEIWVADDRPDYRRAELFPQGCRVLEVNRDFASEALRALTQRQVFAAVVTRCWETDLAALTTLLGLALPDLAYTGLLGSQRKVARVSKELERRGLELEPARFHAPVGLPIGGDSPAEIAVSIMAEMVQERHRGTPRPAALRQLRPA